MGVITAAVIRVAGGRDRQDLGDLGLRCLNGHARTELRGVVTDETFSNACDVRSGGRKHHIGRDVHSRREGDVALTICTDLETAQQVASFTVTICVAGLVAEDLDVVVVHLFRVQGAAH